MKEKTKSTKRKNKTYRGDGDYIYLVWGDENIGDLWLHNLGVLKGYAFEMGILSKNIDIEIPDEFLDLNAELPASRFDHLTEFECREFFSIRTIYLIKASVARAILELTKNEPIDKLTPSVREQVDGIYRTYLLLDEMVGKIKGNRNPKKNRILDKFLMLQEMTLNGDPKNISPYIKNSQLYKNINSLKKNYPDEIELNKSDKKWNKSVKNITIDLQTLEENTMAKSNPTSMVNSHPGFANVQKKIEKSGYSKKEAGAILASSTRNASAKAKKANPKLKKVK